MTLHTYFECYPEFSKTKPWVIRFSLLLLGWILSKTHMQIAMDATNTELVKRRRSRKFRRTELPRYVTSQKHWLHNLKFDTIHIETNNKTISEVNEALVQALEKLS